MSWGSSGPAVFAALVAKFQQIELNGEVRDGPSPGDAAAREVITVGYVGPDDDSSAENTSQSGGLGTRDREQYSVQCACSVLSGDEEVGPTRVRVFELLAACGQQLALDPKLGGACMKASIRQWTLREDMTGGGVFALVRFDVGVEAFTTP